MTSSTQTIKSGRERLWSPTFIVIIGCILCISTVGQSLNTGTTVYLERIGGSATLAGIGALAFSFAAGFMRLFCGNLIDSRGRQIVMGSGAFIMLLGTCGPLLMNDGIMFIIWRVMQGIGFSAATTAASTAAADVLPLSRLGEGIGYSGVGQSIAMAVGPALAVFLASTNPPENFYYGTIFCAIIGVVLTQLVRYEKKPERLPSTSQFRILCDRKAAEADEPSEEVPDDRTALRKFVDSFFEPKALRGAIVICVLSTAMCFNVFYMGSFGLALNVENVGLYYMFCAVMMLLSRVLAGRFMDSIKPIKIMAVAVVCGILAYVLALLCVMGVFENNTIPFFAIAIPFGIAFGLGTPVNQTVTIKLSPPERLGAASALFMLGIDVSCGTASLIWGIVISNLGYEAALIGCIAVLVLSFFVAKICYPKNL